MQKQGLFVSFEGISGVGKSFLCQQLRTVCHDLPIRFISEIIDRHGDNIDTRIIALVRESGDRFFQNPYPLTTTFLLFALAMHDTEAKIGPALADGQILIKDRYIDTLAVYQAILLCPNSFEQQVVLANELYQIGTRWCPAPDITFLVEDDFDTAIQRAQQRNGDCYREDELAILSNAARLYDAYAQHHTSRIVRIKRQETTSEHIVQFLHRHLVLSTDREVI